MQQTNNDNNHLMTERTHLFFFFREDITPSLQYHSSMSVSAVMLDRVIAVAQPILYRKMVHTTKMLEKRLCLSFY